MNNLFFQDFGESNINSDNDFRPVGQTGDQSRLFLSAGTRNHGSAVSKRNVFSYEFYQQYFDIDSDQVLSRILNSIIPRSGSNFITDHIQPHPDLWGPFWISATLVFSTAICGNLAKYIKTSGDVMSHQYESDFRLVTGATTIIFCYIVMVPFILYSVLWYRKTDLQYSYLEILCAYGYSLSIFVPVSILWVLQAQWFRWMLIFMSVMLSGTVIAKSIWLAVKNDHNRTIAFGTVLGIVLLHSLLAVGFKEYYFDTSLATRLETEDFQQQHYIRRIEHSNVSLKVTAVGKDYSAAFNGDANPVKKIGKQAGNMENFASIKDTDVSMTAIQVAEAAAVTSDILKPT